MGKPIIGIVSNIEYINNGNYKKEVNDVNSDYINMILQNGGVPVILPPANCFTEIIHFVDNLDGLLLIGGEDISEACYSNGTKEKSCRDKFELEIYKYFKEKKKPVLGICRGLQLINVAEGGTLKNIDSSRIHHFIEKDGWINYHEIKIINSTNLKKMLKTDCYCISSVHHQAIDRLGKNVIASSKSMDGIIESIEVSDANFIIAFQGHIEKCLENFIRYQNIIKKFIKEASYEKR